MNHTRLADRIAERDAVRLDEVEDVSLLARFDRKYLVPVATLTDVLDRLDSRFRVLDVGGERRIGYETAYFDTPELVSYHAHRQGRRRRFKVRVRHYGDPSGAMLEVKCKNARGQTVKYRTRHPASSPRYLDEAALDFVTESIARHYGSMPRLDLRFVLETRFTRATLVDLEHAERLTIDLGLHVVDEHQAHTFDDSLAIAEAKSAHPHAQTRRALQRPGTRPGPMSKYCMGVAALHPDLPRNRWSRTLRKLAA